MRRYGRFVPHSTIMRRMQAKDDCYARELAARQRKAEALKPRCAICAAPSPTTLCPGCTALIEMEG